MTFRKRHPLVIFFLVWGAYIPFVIYMVAEFCFGYRAIPEWAGTVTAILTFTGIPIYWIWRCSLPYELVDCIPAVIRPKARGFGRRYFSPLIVFLIALPLVFFTQAYHLDNLSEFLVTVFFVIWLMAWFYSYVLTCRVTARLLTMAELKREPTVEEQRSAFFLVLGGAWTSYFLARRTRRLTEEVVGPDV